MTIAEVKVLIDGEITATSEKFDALRALLVAHVSTADWDDSTAAVMIRDIETAYQVMAAYDRLKTTLDGVVALYEETLAAYTAARAALADGAATDTIADLENKTRVIQSAGASYSTAKATYDRYNAPAAAEGLVNAQADYPDVVGRYTY